MKGPLVVFATVLGFSAPLTVALASGVHFGDASAGWFVAAAWFFALVFGGVAVFSVNVMAHENVDS